MKKITLFFFLFALFSFNSRLLGQPASPNYTTPPLGQNVRTMAEWEEIEALVVTWTGISTGFPNIIKEIIRHAKEEVKVIVICNDSIQVINYLSAFSITKKNIHFIQDFYNSVWVRDYGATTIYNNEVDSLYLVDWIYNRPRPFDDRIPRVLSEYQDLSLYSTTNTPYNLVNVGGNFMSDGQGNAFASKLILTENGPQGTYVTVPKTEQEIDSIMKDFMGIKQFSKMEMLNYNPINHIDMYMKLLNEETLLVGEYPNGIADGPQIEANIQYIQDSVFTTFGTPFKIVRIPMPPDTCGNYPDYYGASCQIGSVNNYWGHYRTYTNLVFVNKTVLVPIYSYQYDTTALNILRKELPGYNVVGINCNEMISYYGALHCITKAVGVKKPLLIVHQPLKDTTKMSQGHEVLAKIQHTSQIQTAKIYYTTDTSQGFLSVNMTLGVGDYWIGNIPSQPVGSTVYYYIHSTSFSGKEQVRPITAPKGFWEFDIKATTSIQNTVLVDFKLKPIYPNPSGDKLFIPIETKQKLQSDLSIFDVNGRKVMNIHEGNLPIGKSLFEINVNNLSIGTYFVVLQTEQGKQTQKLLVK
ncbi:MAG: agmatine deiminase family protein [Saprospiraceae bacterium]